MSYEYWSKKMGREIVKAGLCLSLLAIVLSVVTFAFKKLP